ncbi:kinase [Actinokineospora globicatena]|uniref:GHMP family kinase ATP-binding protein n=1 Tax=Actinokineospora globicatena TaxID=103729 RepID=UPI0020A3FAC4|nr:kinase [Actinokineospora globicatena]MCP2303137.1 threonine kinase [Actinokineospora globicatena]GLW79749.1 kinase [Actinokineospora globicatena]GLW85841.1 kinase [Actinokineospora globicatena]
MTNTTGLDEYGAARGSRGCRVEVNQGPVVGHGRACGTFGELLQGVLPDGDRDFLVTLPITEGAGARLTLTGGPGPVLVVPETKRKSHRLVRSMLTACGYEGGAVLELTGRLPEGKGLASSSADLVATARAVADALGARLDSTAIEALLRGIEPSDGVMHDGIVSFYHRESRLRERLGCLPRLTIVGVDEGGQVDTVRHNRVPHPRSGRDKHEYAELLDRLAGAVRTHDLAEVGAVATRSAQLSTKVRPRRHLDALLRITAEAGGLGLAAAHSGTVLGVLIAAHDPEHDAKVRAVVAAGERLAGSVSTFTSLCRHEECLPAAGGAPC